MNPERDNFYKKLNEEVVEDTAETPRPNLLDVCKKMDDGRNASLVVIQYNGWMVHQIVHNGLTGMIIN